MFQAVRRFFEERSVLEVDVPSLVRAPIVDLHIDPMRVGSEFLITSPESGMKQLLAKGSGDIYQIAHVFRAGEKGKLHNPEFTMVEWYRVGMGFEPFIDETVQFISLFVGQAPRVFFSFQEAFLHFLRIDPFEAKDEELRALAELPEDWDRETILHYLMGFVIEPKFDPEIFTVVTDFPESEAALAKIENGRAKRFEVYFGGFELANGYDELDDAAELRSRFVEANRKRVQHGKEVLPLDEELLAAMEKGFPECCGVAVGFDRLLMLKLGADSIAHIQPCTMG